MSTTIDERVLEMRFDNRQFESNVSSTMSTLDKLKQKLNFTGASKGLENVNAAAKNVNMTGLGSAVETVSAKFSAMQVIGVTALANITNSAVNAGKRIVSALTIDPIKTGFQEYETQINATQTILANTKHKGSTIDDVNRALEELNKYADLTIYNFTEMTRNIGTFTAAGIDLDTSVNAIQGIANLAAVSGSTSQQASTAMYQLSQALAAGTIRLMDWNSVVNAGMGGEIFQNALRETSELLGTGAEAAIEATGSFRESLREEWLTAEVLTETLKKFTTSGANEYVAKYTELSLDAVEATIREGEAAAQAAKARGEEADAIDLAAEALAKKSGKNKQEIYDMLDFARNATDAATKVKTFTQLWDVLKESAQSGWSQTWKILVGDFEEARDFLTPLADALTGFIGKMSDWRNSILEFALDFKKPWDSITEKLGISDSGLDKITKIAKSVGDLSDKLEYYQDVVNKVWRGDYKNSDTGRYQLLEKAGYDHRVVQDLVNKGYQYKLTVDDIEESHKKFGLTMDKSSESSKNAAIALEDNAKSLAKLSDEQLRNAGLTEEEIDLYRALEKEAERTGQTIDELTKKMSEQDGRSLLIEGFKNIGTGIMTFASTIKNAWIEIFNPPGVGELAIKLYGIIDSFNEFTKKLTLVNSETGEFSETAKKLQKTFEGVFAIIDIISTVVGGGLKIAFKVVSEILSHFDLNILDVTAAIADAIIGFRDFVDSVIDVGRAVGLIIPYVQSAISAIKDWFESLKTSENLPADIISGLINGLRAGVGMVWDAAVALAKGIVDAVKSFLGIHSPSTVMVEIGENTVEGFKIGISAGVDGLIKAVKAICEKIVGAFKTIWVFLTQDREALDWEKVFGTGLLSDAAGVLKFLVDKVRAVLESLWKFITDGDGNIDWGKILSGGMLFSMVWFLKQIATAINGISEAFGGLGDILENAAGVLKSFSKVLNGYAWDLKAQALQKMAIAIGILVLALVVLTEIDDIGRLWNAVGIIAALAVILVGLAVAMDKMSSAAVSVDKNGAKIDGLKSGLLQIAIAIGVLGFVVKMIGDMTPEQAKQGFIGLAGIAVGLALFIAAMGGISRYSKDLSKIGGMMLKLSIAMFLIIGVLKLIDGLEASEVVGGIIFAAAFAIFVRSIVAVAKSSGNNVSKVGGMMIKLAIAMGLMVGVVKLVDSLSGGEMFKGALFAAGFAVFLKALVACTKIGKKQQLAKIGGLVLSVSFSLTLMAGVCKLVGMLRYGEMIKGAIFMGGFIGMLKLLISVLTIGNEQKMARVSGTILAMATAIAILAAVSVALSFVDLGGLAKGVAAVGLLGLIMSAMVKSLKGANNVTGSLIVMVIALVAMAAAIVALSLAFKDDTSGLIAAAGALSIVMGMFALIAKCSSNINKAAGTILMMTIAVGALATILWLLTNNVKDADSAIKVATSLGILMAALSVSLKMVSGLKSISASAIGAMAGMVLILGGLVGIFAIMNKFDIEPSIETATALSILLLALAGVTAVLTLVGAGAPAALGGIAAFAIVVGGIGLIMAVLGGLTKLFPNLQSWLDTGIDILGQIGTGIGKFVGGVVGGIGEGLMDSLLSMIETFGEIVDKLVDISKNGSDIESGGFDGVLDLVKVLGAIGAVTVGTTLSDIFTLGGTSMEKFQTDAVAFFEAMKAIGEASTGVTIDEEGLSAIIKAGKKLADLQSSIEPIGGLMSCLTGFTDLGTFGATIGKFIESMKVALDSLWGYQFDAQTFDEIVAATKKLADLQSSLEPIGGVISWFTGRDDLAKFGINIAEFITSMKTALSNLEGVSLNEAALESIISASTKLADLQASLEPIGGVITWFTGRDDLGTFGTNVASFISSMKIALATLDGATLNEDALSSVITAAEKLAELQSSLEPMGGVITWFTGRTDLGTFGINIGLFADAMGKLRTAMGETGITEEAITSMTNVGNAVIALIDVLPEEGWFDGKMDLSEFSGYISDFATSLSGFATTAASIDTAAVTTAMATAYQIRDLITSLVGLDTSGIAAFTGIGTGGFGADGPVDKIGRAITAYSNEVAGIDTSAVSTSVTAANQLKTLISSLSGLDASGVENFKIEAIGKQMGNYANKVKDLDGGIVSQSISAANRLKTFIGGLTSLDASGVSNFKVESVGKAMRSYSSSVSGMNSGAVSSSISAATRLKTFITGLAGINTSGVGSFKTAIKELSTVKVSELVRAFSGASSKMATAGSDMIEGLINGMKSKISSTRTVVSDLLNELDRTISSKTSTFQKVGGQLMSKFATGLSSGRSAAKSAVTGCVSSSVSSLRSYYSSFYSAGSYLVSGFAAGISANSYKAAAKARAMANAAEKAARDALAINSPSKVFREIGMGIPEGFIQGIEKLSGSVDKSLIDMADGAIYSVGDTISKLASLVESDIDSQPTIRPVLDLSDVRSGAATIGNLFDTNSQVGVMANVGTVSTMMRGYGQNGGTSDIVSAIDKLRKDLGNISGDTYSVGNVTYDDGSNIADAVKTITRVARMERRI